MVTHELVPALRLVSPDDCEPLLPDAADGEVEVWEGNDGFEAYGYVAGGYLWAYLPGTAAFRFLADESHVVAISDDRIPPHLVEDSYYRNVLPLVLQLRGHEALHASAVRVPRGLVVLCGVSGAGKSTFAHALSARGYPVWADDAVVLDTDGEAATAIRVPFRLGLRREAATFFAHELGDRGHDEAAPARSPIVALVILERSEESDAPLVDITRLQATGAFTALLPHAYYFRLSDPPRNALMLDRYLRLASAVPIFAIRYRPGLGDIVAVVDEVERQVLAG